LVFARQRLLPAELRRPLRLHRNSELRCPVYLHRRAKLLCSASLCGRPDVLRTRCPDLLRTDERLWLCSHRTELLCSGRPELLRTDDDRMLQCRPKLCGAHRMRLMRHRLHLDLSLLPEKERLPRPHVGSRKAEERLPEGDVPGMDELRVES
jgi:hypothetical protein